jgi:putative endonuclease
MTQWHLYIIRCDGRYLYTGISTDVERRVAEHRAGKRKAAACTRPFSSIVLVFQVSVGDRSTAAKIEYRIKKLPKRDKEVIVSSRFDRNELMMFVGLPAPDTGARPDGN